MSNKPYYPPVVFLYASDEEREEILAGNSEYLDHEAAELLDIIADCPRVAWADLAAVRKMRQTLRSVSGWLRERAT